MNIYSKDMRLTVSPSWSLRLTFSCLYCTSSMAILILSNRLRTAARLSVTLESSCKSQAASDFVSCGASSWVHPRNSLCLQSSLLLHVIYSSTDVTQHSTGTCAPNVAQHCFHRTAMVFFHSETCLPPAYASALLHSSCAHDQTNG